MRGKNPEYKTRKELSKAFDLFATGEQLKQVMEFRHTLNDETDRGCALMVAAYLDAELERLLRASFIENSVVEDLLGPSKPIGNFSSRIDLAYALGFISPAVHRDLHLIRKVRNEFGHRHEPIAFTDPAIADRCSALYYHGTGTGASVRQRFVRTAMGTLAQIHATIGVMKHNLPQDDVPVGKLQEAFQKFEKSPKLREVVMKKLLGVIEEEGRKREGKRRE